MSEPEPPWTLLVHPDERHRDVPASYQFHRGNGRENYLSIFLDEPIPDTTPAETDALLVEAFEGVIAKLNAKRPA